MSIRFFQAHDRELLAAVDDAETALVRVADDPSPAISLFDPDWHPGVVGLVASKLKERSQTALTLSAPNVSQSRRSW